MRVSAVFCLLPGCATDLTIICNKKYFGPFLKDYYSISPQYNFTIKQNMTDPSPSNFNPSLSQTNLNRRSQSVLTQLSYASRQNLQNAASNGSVYPQKSQPSSQYNTYSTQSKENMSKMTQKMGIYDTGRNQSYQGMTQNDALRQQMQNMRQSYQGEISKLKRNITLKDQLLDQCQAEIGNLRTIYRQLITQFQDIKTHTSQKEEKEAPKKNSNQNNALVGFIAKRNSKTPEGNLLPLSIMNQGMSKSGSSSSVAGPKMTHGLIKGRS